MNNLTEYKLSNLPPKPKITEREIEVLKLISLEFTTKEIASMLYISSHTVDSHKKNLKYKLKVKNSVGLIRKSFELGLLRVIVKPLTMTA